MTGSRLSRQRQMRTGTRSQACRQREHAAGALGVGRGSGTRGPRGDARESWRGPRASFVGRQLHVVAALSDLCELLQLKPQQLHLGI